MKSPRTYLIVMCVLLFSALLIGIGVWYLYQDMSGANPLVNTEGNTPNTLND